MQIASSRLEPRKRSLANAKPARVQKVTVPSVTAPDTISELIRPRLSGARSSAWRMLWKIEEFGSSGGVPAAISAFVCDAITIV